jgi:hypothetical protein
MRRAGSFEPRHVASGRLFFFSIRLASETEAPFVT